MAMPYTRAPSASQAKRSVAGINRGGRPATISGGGEILGRRIRQARAVEDALRLVAHAQHGVANGARRLVLAVGAAAIGGAADAGHQRERPLDHADDLAERDEVLGPGEAIAAHLAAVAVQEPGLAQIGENQLEELARYVGPGRDAVHRDRRAAHGGLGEKKHRAQRVAGTLGQHNITAMARYCGMRKAGFSLCRAFLFEEASGLPDYGD